MAVVLLVQV